jgi:hypothetical protein
MSVLLLFPKCPVHSNPLEFGDSGGNSAAPPRPSPKAGAAFSLPRERGSYRRRDACVFPAGLPDTREESRALLLIETVSVLMGLWIAECALLLLFMGYVR